MNIACRHSLKVSSLTNSLAVYSHLPIKPILAYMTSSLNQNYGATVNKFSVDELKKVSHLFPKLSNKLKKGDCGKVGVIGGSAQYTGAPYFAASTPIKIGADLSYLFCHPSASGVIKSYSPELMVNPTLDFHQIEATLSRLDVLVFGPGIGRDKQVLVPLLENILAYVHRTPSICLVIDADGIFLLGDCVNSIKQCKNAIVTPNHREFERLYQAAFGSGTMDNNGDQHDNYDSFEKPRLPVVTKITEEEPQGQSTQSVVDQVKKLASHIGICILRKGDTDIITDGKEVLVGKKPGSMRRCGGQGDILSGATALFAYWAKLKTGCEEYRTEHILEGALAASDFVRFTSRLTFDRIGRSMNAADIIAQMPDVVKNLDENNL